jgi:hypothetical protein
MHTVWPIVVMLLTGPVSGDRPAVAALPRVRAAENAMKLLGEAAAASPTVRALIDRIAATDVIVYVEITASPQAPMARTKLVIATAGARFLRIGLNRMVPPPDVTPLIAHELQHALEIAEHADVRDEAAVRRLYGLIGHQHGTDSYETDAARQVERVVRAETRRARSESRIPDP